MLFEQSLPTIYYGFVFFSTLFIYGIHRIIGIQKTFSLNQKGRYNIVNTYKSHIQLYTVLSGIALVYFFFQLSSEIQLFFIVPGCISILYTLPLFAKKRRLRDVHYIKIFLIAFVWAITTAIIPAYLLNKSTLLIAILGLERFLFFLSITIPFDIRDRLIDQQSEVKTLVHRLGIENSLRLSVGALVAAFLLNYYLFYTGFISIQSLLAFGITYLITAVSIVCVGRLTADYYFTGLLDGTMIALGFFIWICHSL